MSVWGPHCSESEPCLCCSHAITAWFGLERTFKRHLVQPPCNKQGYQLHQVAESPIQPILDVSRDGAGITLGQPVPVSHHTD